MSVNICLYLSISAYICQYLPISVNICQYLSISETAVLWDLNNYIEDYIEVSSIQRFRHINCYICNNISLYLFLRELMECLLIRSST